MKKNGKKMQKRSITLVELIVVIALIGIITGALAFNYRGSLETGRAFKTRELINKIEQLSAIASAEEGTVDPKVIERKIKESPLLTEDDRQLKDAWKQPISIEYDAQQNRFTAKSQGLNDYEKHNKPKPGSNQSGSSG